MAKGHKKSQHNSNSKVHHSKSTVSPTTTTTVAEESIKAIIEEEEINSGFSSYLRTGEGKLIFIKHFYKKKYPNYFDTDCFVFIQLWL